MKILLTGVNGQVGTALKNKISKCNHEIIEINRVTWDMAQSPKKGRNVVLNNKPEMVINIAAYTDVRSAEKYHIDAFNVNRTAVEWIAKGCLEINIPLIHISTDYVFNGEKNIPYLEGDSVGSNNIYGRSKAEGEAQIINMLEKYIILRTSWVFSKNSKNFVSTILKLLSERKEIKIVKDQYGGPTSAECVAEVLMKFIAKHDAQQTLNWGIYHYSGQPYVSWLEFAEYIYKKWKENSKKQVNIIGVEQGEYEDGVTRPKNSMLDNGKIARNFEVKSCDWKAHVDLIIKK